MNTLLQDVRYALRLLARNPGFAGVAVLVLALGIGANTAVFSLVNAMLLAPIPAGAPDIVGIYSRHRQRPDSYRSFSWETYQQVRETRELFTDVLAHTMTMVGVSEGENTRRSFVSVASANYFSTLGIGLAAGRTFTAAEERPGAAERVAIVSHAFARRLEAAPASVIGRTIRVNTREFTVVGVAPEGFSGTTALVTPDFWLPLGVYEDVTNDMLSEALGTTLSRPDNRPLMLIGRLRPGVTAAAAAPRLATLSAQLERQDPAGNEGQELSVHSLPRLSISTSPQPNTVFNTLSGLLMGMAALVLLIACLNLANMLLARGTARRKEIALRLALGSGRLRVVRQLLTESLLIAIAGGGAGLLLAVTATRLLVATLADVLPIGVAFDATPDIRVMAATFGFCLLSTVMAGLGPAWRVSRPDVLPDLKEQPPDRGAGRRLSMRNLLVVGQIALSLALVTAAGLFARGAVKAAVADPGFPLEGGVVAGIEPSMARYDESRGRAAVRAILQRARAIPGVQAASVASLVPFGELSESQLVQTAGTPPAPQGQREVGVSATFTIVGADYFETLRVPVMRGRAFTAAEEEASSGARVAVVDEPLARQLFAGEDPLGQAVQFRNRRGGEAGAPLEVVGVVAGTRHDMFDKAPVPHVFVPFGQHYRGAMNLHVRGAATGEAAEAALVRTVRDEIRAADPGVPVISIKTLRQHRDGSIMLWAVNAGARLFSAFGAVALLLAIVGVYGVKAYVVSRRTREIGIRMALGASSRDVLWLVLREGLALTAVGLALGLGLAAIVGQLLSRLLYEVGALDPLVFVAAPVLLAAAAMAACYLPARRATRVVPLAALRE